MISAVMIDSREPGWVQQLSFGGAPVSITTLPCSDAMVACDDGAILLVERKTPDDLLNSIKDGRLFHQIADMVTQSRWVYVVVSGDLLRNGKLVVTERGQTGWNYGSVWGALLTAQELGAFIIFCAGDQDYEACILRLAERKHEIEHVLEPPKYPKILSAQEQIIASLPGIGLERLQTVMDMAGNHPALALMLLTDPQSEIPGISNGIKDRIRKALKLADSEQLVLSVNEKGQEILEIIKT